MQILSIFQMFDDLMTQQFNTPMVDPSTVTGEMTVPMEASSPNFGEPGFNTLDEPIKETIVLLVFIFNC